MRTTPIAWQVFAAFTLSSLLTACGGGGSEGNSTSPPPPVFSTSQISGTAVKGTMRNALISAYKINANGQKEALLASTRTSDTGAYNLTIKDYAGLVLLELTSDSQTTMRCDLPNGCENGKAFGDVVPTNLTLQALLPELQADNQAAITPYTHLASQYAQRATLNKTTIEQAYSQVEDLFDLPNILTTIPSDISDTASNNLDSQRYGVMNAAIGQMAGQVDKINTQINLLATELKTRNGQLLSSEIGHLNNLLDLADVLDAAQTVANHAKVSPKIHQLTRAIISANLAQAQASQGLTTARPSDNAGSSDIAKAKAFMHSANSLVNVAQQYENHGLVNVLKQKTQAIRSLTDGNILLADALNSSLILLLQGIADTDVNRTYHSADLQSLLDRFVNTPDLYVSAHSNSKMAVDVENHNIRLNGTLSIQPMIRGNDNRYVKDGLAQSFQLNNFTAIFPNINDRLSSITLSLYRTSKISTPDLELAALPGSDSTISMEFTSSASLKEHIAALNRNELVGHIPNTMVITLGNIGLTALKANTSEFNRFVGSGKMTLTARQLDTSVGLNNQRFWPVPQQLNLIGAFSGSTADTLDASANITFDATSNPLTAPDKGYIRPQLYRYQYVPAEHAIYLHANSGVFNNYYWSKDKRLKVVLSDKRCALNNYYLIANDNIYLSCTDKTNVTEAFKEVLTASPYSAWFSNTYIQNEGTYRPHFPATFNFNSNNLGVDGKLDWSDNSLYENSTHFTIGTVNLSTQIKLTNHSPIDAQITAQRTGFSSGEYLANLRIGDDRIHLKSLTIDGTPEVTLINKDNIGVDIALLEQNNIADIKINNRVVGQLYKFNGLPVARFIDNSIIAL